MPNLLSQKLPHIYKKTLFLEQFWLHSKIERMIWRFPRYPPLPLMHSPPVINISTREVQLLQLMNLHGHIVITQSPWFTLERKVKVAQSCPTLCDPMDYTVHNKIQTSQFINGLSFSISMHSISLLLILSLFKTCVCCFVLSCSPIVIKLIILFCSQNY